MSKLRKQSIIIGLLILCSFVFGVLSVAPSIDSNDYLHLAAENSIGVKLAVVSQLMLAFTYLAIAVMIFNVLLKYDSIIAYGYLIVKTSAQVFNILGTIFIIAILLLSKLSGDSSLDSPGIYVQVGELLKYARDYVNHVIMIIMSNMAVFLFSFIAFKYRLVPRWISSLGFLGSFIGVLASVLVLFDLIDIVTIEYMLLNLPAILQDFILAFFLIFIGFNERKVTSPE